MNPPAYRTLIEALEAAPPDRPFVTMWEGDDEVQTVTFGEFTRWAEAQAAHFNAHGLRQGDRAILIMPQGIGLMTAFIGAMRLGAVPAILAYPNFKVEPNKYRSGLFGVTSNLKARLIVLDSAFPAELLGFVTVPEGGEIIRGIDQIGSGDPPALPPCPARPGSLAFLQHSAGTTGLQKGVALTHVTVLRHLDHLGQVLRIQEDDRVYSWLPLYHDMGLIACFMLPLVFHLHLVMQSPTQWVMQPATMLQLMSKYRCTLAWLPNFAFRFLARRVPSEDLKGIDLSSLRALINCSEPVRRNCMDEFLTELRSCGLKPEALQTSYAMAETVFAVTQSKIDGRMTPRREWVDGGRFQAEHVAVPVPQTAESAVCFTSSGPCIPGSEVRIVDAMEEALPAGHVGEILIHTDTLFEGYYNHPDLTAKALKDGWYRSGDLGFCLGNELYVIGRKKDLIIVAGKNIYPQDVEEIICAHPAIHDGRAVALGIYNPDLGTEDIIGVAEVEREEDLNKASEIELAIRNSVATELGVTVRALYLKPPRWIVKSTAGKPARSTSFEKLVKEHAELAHSRVPWETTQ